MLISTQNSQHLYRCPPISNVTVNNNTVMFLNASGQQKVKLDTNRERTQFIKWLLS